MPYKPEVTRSKLVVGITHFFSFFSLFYIKKKHRVLFPLFFFIITVTCHIHHHRSHVTFIIIGHMSHSSSSRSHVTFIIIAVTCHSSSSITCHFIHSTSIDCVSSFHIPTSSLVSASYTTPFPDLRYFTPWYSISITSTSSSSSSGATSHCD